MPHKKYVAIVKQHLPRGAWLVERELEDADGLAHASGQIVCKPIIDRHTLAVFLHECGHVWCKHFRECASARQEYEADMYAIGAMKAAGIAIPRDTLRWWKQVSREHIEHEGHGEDDLLRYAYGREWRKHR